MFVAADLVGVCGCRSSGCLWLQVDVLWVFVAADRCL